MPKKCFSCRPDGTMKRQRRVMTVDDRIAQKCKLLGIDRQEFMLKQELRLFTRVSSRTLTNPSI